MSFDLKTALSSVAPTLAAMLGGPLAGAALSALEGCFGLAPGSGEAGITKVMQAGGMTPDIIAKVRAADQRHEEVMGQQGIDVLKINKDHDAAMAVAEAGDRDSARRTNAGRDVVWWIGTGTLVTFALIMLIVLYGCYALITGGMKIADPGVLAAVAGLVGSVVGYAAGNAGTVINFIFGGSLGSDKRNEAMAASVKQAIGTLGR